jgi:hypothetical protein
VTCPTLAPYKPDETFETMISDIGLKAENGYRFQARPSHVIQQTRDMTHVLSFVISQPDGLTSRSSHGGSKALH